MELGNSETSVLEAKKPKVIKFSVRLMCIQSESSIDLGFYRWILSF